MVGSSGAVFDVISAGCAECKPCSRLGNSTGAVLTFSFSGKVAVVPASATTGVLAQ